MRVMRFLAKTRVSQDGLHFVIIKYKLYAELIKFINIHFESKAY